MIDHLFLIKVTSGCKQPLSYNYSYLFLIKVTSDCKQPCNYIIAMTFRLLKFNYIHMTCAIEPLSINNDAHQVKGQGLIGGHKLSIEGVIQVAMSRIISILFTTDCEPPIE